MKAALCTIFALSAFFLTVPASALPTMIRLGYPNCVSCHVSPQGGGLLNSYGHGIDDAQSLRAGEYRPNEGPLWSLITANGRIDQDFRLVSTGQVNTATGQPMLGVEKVRVLYRNVTQLGHGLQVTATIGGENEPTFRKTTAYDPATREGTAFLATALLDYKPTSNLQFSFGRDQLPTGLNIPDQTVFIKARNRLGYYDTPTQMKMFWWGKRYQITPFVFRRSGEENTVAQESGGGALAEVDVLGKGRTVLGASYLRGNSRLWDRNVTGGYARLGFGRWGVLAEHDYTTRQRTGLQFSQHASYVQPFLAVREWLVISAVGERLSVQRPYSENFLTGKGEVSARLTPAFSITVRGGVQRDMLTGRIAPTVSLQLAFKTVN